MRATKTTIRFKLSRAEDARALEYLRDQKAAGSSFSKSVVQAINDCLDAQEAESREDSFMGRFRLMLREELKAAGTARITDFCKKTESTRSPSWKHRFRKFNPRLKSWKRNAVKPTIPAAGQRHRRRSGRPKAAKRNLPRKLRRCGRSYGRQKRFWRNPHMYTNCCKKNTAWNRRHIKDSEKG